jgi:hypothetical protein
VIAEFLLRRLALRHAASGRPAGPRTAKDPGHEPATAPFTNFICFIRTKFRAK